jgi:hypothetical protein
MKRAYFACLFLSLTTTCLLSQSNPAPSINQTASVADLGHAHLNGDVQRQHQL